MLRCLISTILIEFLLNLTPADSACIFLNDCAVALKYIEKKKNSAETVSILQKAHCGFGQQNGQREPKVSCDQIPPFPELPTDCVRFLDCPAAVQLIEKRRDDPKTIQLLQSSTCGDSERRDMVLCDKITNVMTKTSPLPIMGQCGQQLTPKIVSGTAAELDDFGWIALLKFKNKTGHLKYGCHGSLISKKYVLTAAHCFTSRKLKLHSVVLGEYNITTPIDCIGTDCALPIQEFSVDSVLSHPQFHSRGALNDIALLRLNDSANFTDFVRPICLLNLAPLRKNEPLWISGWGETENGTMSDVKLKARILSLTKDDCTEYINLTPDDTMLCAGSNNGADTCRGDSGGPLMVQRALNDGYNFFLAGLLSFGGKCGSRAAIYTNVTRYYDWIEDNMID